MATIDELHAQSVGGDIDGLKRALIKALRTGTEFVSPPADGPGAAAVAGIRSLLPGRGSFSQEFDRYNRAAAPSPLYSGPEKFGSIVKEPGALGQSQGESAQAQAMAMQTALIAAIRQAAFKHRKTGQVQETGPIHDLTQLPDLPETYAKGRMEAINQWEDGFTTDKGKFLNRTEAAEHVGRLGELDSADTAAGKAELAKGAPDWWAKEAFREAAPVPPSPEAAAAKVLREVGVGSRPGKVVMEVPLEEAFKFRFNDILDPTTGEPHPLPHVSRGVSGKQRWDSLRSSVEQSGINTPIEVGLWSADEGIVPKVLDGNHRLAVAKDLGLPSIQVDLDRDVAKKIGWLK